VSQNRVLSSVLGPKREEVAGGWKRLHNEEPHNLYALPNITSVIKSRRMAWTEHVARMGEVNEYQILIGKSDGKRPLRRPRCKLEDNNKLDLREVV
jgi:hypothetical protein